MSNKKDVAIENSRIDIVRTEAIFNDRLVWFAAKDYTQDPFPPITKPLARFASDDLTGARAYAENWWFPVSGATAPITREDGGTWNLMIWDFGGPAQGLGWAGSTDPSIMQWTHNDDGTFVHVATGLYLIIDANDVLTVGETSKVTLAPPEKEVVTSPAVFKGGENFFAAIGWNDHQNESMRSFGLDDLEGARAVADKWDFPYFGFPGPILRHANDGYSYCARATTGSGIDAIQWGQTCNAGDGSTTWSTDPDGVLHNEALGLNIAVTDDGTLTLTEGPGTPLVVSGAEWGGTRK
jgi:hypothetical protein